MGMTTVQRLEEFFPVIKVIGIGKGGTSTVNRMLADGITGAEYVTLNTDEKCHNDSNADKRLLIGSDITKGKGADAYTIVGYSAAKSCEEEIKSILKDADLVIITAGLGGGTGTGAAPVVARIAKQMGILTLAIVTEPLSSEGNMRSDISREGIASLEKNADTVIVVPVDRFAEVCGLKLSSGVAYGIADEFLAKWIGGMIDVLGSDTAISLDLADMKTIFMDSKRAYAGLGQGSGEKKAELAVESVVSSPLLSGVLKGARSIIIIFKGSTDVTLEDINVVTERISGEAHPDAYTLFGVVFDSELDDTLEVTVTVIDVSGDGIK